MSKYKLFLGDCREKMGKLPESCTDLIITSPPYDNLRTYEDGVEWDFSIFKEVATQIVRVMKEGSTLVWVVGDSVKDGSESGSSFKQALWFKKLGLKLHDTMIYIKNGGINRGSLKAYQQKFEYMFVFVKGKIKTVNLIKDRRNKYVEDRIKKVRQKDGTFKEQHFKSNEYGVRYNYWIYDTGLHDEKEFKHPAQFPLQLAIDHIKSWTNEGDIVLDPFMGSGTTGVACLNLNRKFCGIELVEKYFNIAKERIEKANENNLT